MIAIMGNSMSLDDINRKCENIFTQNFFSCTNIPFPIQLYHSTKKNIIMKQDKIDNSIGQNVHSKVDNLLSVNLTKNEIQMNSKSLESC